MPKRKTKKSPPTMMERARAAKEYINRVPHSPKSQDELELRAFMSIFHPEAPQEIVDMMVNAKKYGA